MLFAVHWVHPAFFLYVFGECCAGAYYWTELEELPVPFPFSKLKVQISRAFGKSVDWLLTGEERKER
jgi:hypothetical protein